MDKRDKTVVIEIKLILPKTFKLLKAFICFISNKNNKLKNR